jgi:3-dehydroquinate synthase
MIIKSHAKKYSAEIKDAIYIAAMLKKPCKLAVVDGKVYDLYKNSLLAGLKNESLYLFDAVEKNKTAASALKICKKMAETGFKRSDELISIGGGIVQDVTGFSADIFNRGVKWTFIPTTLLAQADSCIGGKTSLNFSSYKNILGTFFAPDNIYICLDFVKTLEKDDYLSGMGEVAKFNIMSAGDGIGLLEKNMKKLLSRDTKTLKFFVERSLSFKKKFIEEDEYDFGVRNLLNFAHTFGHAFEKVSKYAIPHGQAVTLGMISANNISFARKILGKEMKERIEKICLNFVSVKMKKDWFQTAGIIEAVKKDKKDGTGRGTEGSCRCD